MVEGIVAGVRFADEIPSMTSVVEPTEVTLPVAKPKPAGRDPDRAAWFVDGGVPPENEPEGRRARPWKPPVQAPVGLARVMDTVFATSVPVESEPLTVTQSPTFTDEAGTLTVLLNRVEDVQLTVTCPICWFCTSIEEPAIAATDPEAPGKEPPPGASDAPEPLPEAPEVPLPDVPLPDVPLPESALPRVLAWLAPPQAARRAASATAPDAKMRGARRAIGRCIS